MRSRDLTAAAATSSKDSLEELALAKGKLASHFLTGVKLKLTGIFGSVGGLKRQLVIAMAGTFALNFASKFLMLFASALLARIMEPGNYGVYATAVAAVTLVGVPASLGLPNLIVRDIAAYDVREEWSLMKGLLLRSNQAALLVVAVLGLLLLSWQVAVSHPSRYDATVEWTTFALLPLTLLGAMRMATLRGLHSVVLGLMPETLVLPIVLISCVMVWNQFLSTPLSPEIVLAIRLFAAFCAFVVGTIFLFLKMPNLIRHVKPEYQMGKWIGTAWPLMWVGAMSVITTQTDVIMLAALKGPKYAGIYQVAARGAELVGFISTVSALALQPTISMLYVKGDLKSLRQVSARVSLAMASAATIIAILFFGFGSTILRAAFGRGFDDGAIPLSILSVAWVFVACFGPVRDTLIMTGGEKAAAISISVAALMNVIFNILLIPIAGVAGAAVATSISLVLCHGGYSLAVRWRLGFWMGLASVSTRQSCK